MLQKVHCGIILGRLYTNKCLSTTPSNGHPGSPGEMGRTFHGTLRHPAAATRPKCTEICIVPNQPETHRNEWLLVMMGYSVVWGMSTAVSDPSVLLYGFCRRFQVVPGTFGAEPLLPLSESARELRDAFPFTFGWFMPVPACWAILRLFRVS